MGVAMHGKSDSEAMSMEAATSPPRPVYFVQSPSHQDYSGVDHSSPFGSPAHHLYNHSRESSTSRFSASLMVKSGSRSAGAWRRLYTRGGEGKVDDDDDDDVAEEEMDLTRFYVVCFLVLFVVLFTVFSFILWAAATTYPPKIHVQGMVFERFNVHASPDDTGVPTNMLALNSTVRIFYRNPATFFGVHVSSTPLELHYYEFKVATGYMKTFYLSRKSKQWIKIPISADEEPLYGAIPLISEQKGYLQNVKVPLNLTFVMRSRAYVLGRLVKPTFYKKIMCRVTLKPKELGKHQKLANHCTYDE